MGAWKTISVALELKVASYMAGLAKTSAATKQWGSETEAAQQRHRDAWDKIGKSALVGASVLAVGFAFAANATMGFDKQLSALQGATSATGAQMGQLRQQALDAGAATVYSARQAAEAQTELAKAGVSVRDILGGGLSGALALAAAGNLDLARAAEISANAMTTFNLRGSDVARIADTLAAGANKSAADVDDIAQAMSQSGLVAAQFGLTLEDTVGTLSMFAQAGLRGSDSGTSLKTMLQRLVPQSQEAKNKMAELGIEMFDAQGNFVGIEGAAQQLKTALSGLTQEQRASAMQTIFGSDAVRAATVLYSGGGEAVKRWRENVTDAGYATDLARTKLDNLAGDLEQLRGSIETALITGGSKGTGALRIVAQTLTAVVNGLSQIPAGIQVAGLGLLAMAAAGLGTVGMLAKLGPRLVAVQLQLMEMGPAGLAAAAGLGALTVGLSALVIGAIPAITLMGNIKAQAQGMFGEFQTSHPMGNTYNELLKYKGQLSKAFDEIRGVGKGSSLKEFGQNLSPFNKNTISEAQAASRIYGQQIDDVVTKILVWDHSANTLANTLGMSRVDVEAYAQALQLDLSDPTVNLQDMAVAIRAAAEAATPGTPAAAAIDEIKQKADDAKNAVKALSDGLRGTFDPLFGMVSALNANRDAQAEVTGAIWKNNDANKDNNVSKQEVADLNLRVAQTAVEARDRAYQLADAMLREGQTADAAKAQLQVMVDQHLITAASAKDVAAQIDNAAKKAGEFGAIGEVKATLGLVDNASSGLDSIYQKLLRITEPQRIHIAEIKDRQRRWGGVDVYAMAAGGVTQAHVARDTVYKYAEYETGGEAFIPRLGNPSRSSQILDIAAGWYNKRVVPMAAGGISYLPSSGSHSTMIDARTTIDLRGASITGVDDLDRHLDAKLEARDRELRRYLRAS